MAYVKRVKRSVRPKRRAIKRSVIRRKPMALRRAPRRIVTNTAAVRENYTVSLQDGLTTFYSESLAALSFDRAQSVASSFQEYRIKYVKLTFRPSADTFAPAAGNAIPQLYFQMNKFASIPTSATQQTLLDMGCRPIRFDDKNIVRAFKPNVLIGADQAPPGVVINAQKPLTTPWLSTNNNAMNPGTLWQPSNVQHYGACWLVTKMNPSTPTINYYCDIEVVFQFRKPLAQVPPTTDTPNVFLHGGEVRPVMDGSGNQVVST